MHRITGGVVAIFSVLSWSCTQVAEREKPMAVGTTPAVPLRLENSRIAVEIDRHSGAINSIRDKEQDESYGFDAIGFEIVTDTGLISSKKALKVNADQNQVELHFAAEGLDIKLHYSLGAEDHFVEKDRKSVV